MYIQKYKIKLSKFSIATNNHIKINIFINYKTIVYVFFIVSFYFLQKIPTSYVTDILIFTVLKKLIT